MHATLRRYEGVDRERTDELTEKVTDSLMPRLSELPGFNGYYLIEARDLDHALEIGKLCPARFGGVEVRPIMVFG